MVKEEGPRMTTKERLAAIRWVEAEVEVGASGVMAGASEVVRVLKRSGIPPKEAKTVMLSRAGIVARHGLMVADPLDEKLVREREAERPLRSADQGHHRAAAMVGGMSGAAAEMVGAVARKVGAEVWKAGAASVGVVGSTPSETEESGVEVRVEIAGRGPAAGGNRESRAVHRRPAMTEMRT
jgi:hypothetical protein